MTKTADQLDLFGAPAPRPVAPRPTPAPRAQPIPGLQGAALFSDCGRYRFKLERWWGPGPRALWILTNPSKAGADPIDTDPTVTRLIERSRQGGASGLNLMNPWPYIATEPADLWAQPDAVRLGSSALVGGQSLDHDALLLETIAASSATIVVGWGGAPSRKADREAWRARTTRVLDLVREAKRHAYALGSNADGSPVHPLYISYARELELYGDGFIL